MPTIKLGDARKNFMAAQEARRRLIKKGINPADVPPAVRAKEAGTATTRRSSSAPSERKKKAKPARKKLQVEMAKRIAAAEERSRQKLTAFRATLAKQGEHYKSERQQMGVVAASEMAVETMASAAEIFATMREYCDSKLSTLCSPYHTACY